MREGLDFRGLCEHLGASEYKVRYWLALLKQHDLVEKRVVGVRHLYSPIEVENFRKLSEYLSNGVTTATEAIKLIKGQLTPAEAIDRAKYLNAQVEALQRKLVALRKPNWFERVTHWFERIFRKRGGRNTELS